MVRVHVCMHVHFMQVGNCLSTIKVCTGIIVVLELGASQYSLSGDSSQGSNTYTPHISHHHHHHGHIHFLGVRHRCLSPQNLHWFHYGGTLENQILFMYIKTYLC